MKTRDCSVCGVTFTYSHPRATYCSSKCRKTAAVRRAQAEQAGVKSEYPVQYGPRSAEPQPVQVSDARQTVPKQSGRGPVERALYRELKELGALRTSGGELALTMGRRADSGSELGSSLASLTRQITQTMDEVREQAGPVNADPVDELRQLRDSKRGLAS